MIKLKDILERKLKEASGHSQQWYGFYKGKKIKFKANFPADAKKYVIDKFKVSKICYFIKK